MFAKTSVAEWLQKKEHLPHSARRDPPNLDIVGALRELEAHGGNAAACRLFVSAQGEPLNLEELERYLHKLLAAGIKKVPLASV
jgi:hypothetical protein